MLNTVALTIGAMLLTSFVRESIVMMIGQFFTFALLYALLAYFFINDEDKDDIL
jgi:hypothetical protein